MDAVTVSINFGDYLATAMAHNRPLFDRFVVVTVPNDYETIGVARNHGCLLCYSDWHRSNPASINKGRAINEGLSLLAPKGWICHVDADTVVLPELMQSLMQSIDTPPTVPTLYGACRYLCDSYAAWCYYITTGKTDRFRLRVHRRPWHLPVGYFQSWYAPWGKRYPENIDSVQSSDLAFAKQFSRKRILQECVINLSSVKHKRGINAYGRSAPAWGSN